jgi:hypothetical protein
MTSTASEAGNNWRIGFAAFICSEHRSDIKGVSLPKKNS